MLNKLVSYGGWFLFFSTVALASTGVFTRLVGSPHTITFTKEGTASDANADCIYKDAVQDFPLVYKDQTTNPEDITIYSPAFHGYSKFKMDLTDIGAFKAELNPKLTARHRGRVTEHDIEAGGVANIVVFNSDGTTSQDWQFNLWGSKYENGVLKKKNNLTFSREDTDVSVSFFSLANGYDYTYNEETEYTVSITITCYTQP